MSASGGLFAITRISRESAGLASHALVQLREGVVVWSRSIPVAIQSVLSLGIFGGRVEALVALVAGGTERLLFDAHGGLVSRTAYHGVELREAVALSSERWLAVSGQSPGPWYIGLLEAGSERWRLAIGSSEPPLSSPSADGRVAVAAPLAGEPDTGGTLHVIRVSDGGLIRTLELPMASLVRSLHFDRAGRLWVFGSSRSELLEPTPPKTAMGSDVPLRAFAIVFDAEGRRLGALQADTRSGGSSVALDPAETADGTLYFRTTLSAGPRSRPSTLRSTFAKATPLAVGSQLVAVMFAPSSAGSLHIHAFAEAPVRIAASPAQGLFAETRSTRLPSPDDPAPRCRLGQPLVPKSIEPSP